MEIYSEKNARICIYLKILWQDGTNKTLLKTRPECGKDYLFTKSYKVELSAPTLQRILSVEGCAGIRLFPGFFIDDALQVCPTVIIVAVSAKGFDISSGAGYIRCQHLVV
jgi:hypothetical protein